MVGVLVRCAGQSKTEDVGSCFLKWLVRGAPCHLRVAIGRSVAGSSTGPQHVYLGLPKTAKVIGGSSNSFGVAKVDRSRLKSVEVGRAQLMYGGVCRGQHMTVEIGRVVRWRARLVVSSARVMLVKAS